MPNLLGHIGAQGFITRGLIQKADVKWVCLGCLVPDIPWILQRVVHQFGLPVDRYDLRLYGVLQASLVFCLILAATLAWASRNPPKVFTILGLNAFLHLILDGLEKKWAGGSHLLAPFSWWNSDLELFWPENHIIDALTGLGILYLWLALRKGHRWHSIGVSLDWKRIAGVSLMLALYFAGPLPFLKAAEKADVHSIGTLRAVESRPARRVELDRSRYSVADGRPQLRLFSGEILVAAGDLPPAPGTVSVRGRFVDSKTLQIEEYHVHRNWFRDAASYVGLLLLAFVWLWDLAGRGGRRSHSPTPAPVLKNQH